MDITSKWQTYLNGVFPSKYGPHNPVMETSGFTIFSLLTRLVSNVDFQAAVLAKLVEFTSKTTEFLSGEHLKPKKFATLIPILKKTLAEGPDPKSETVCPWIVDLSVSQDPEAYEIADIWAAQIKKKKDTDELVHGEPGSLYHYPTIIFESIAGKQTIVELGEAGFVAALLVFCRWKHFVCEVKSMKELAVEKFAQQVNANADAVREALPENISREEIISKFCHGVPQEIVNDTTFRTLLDEDIQQFLFGESDDGEGHTVKVDDNGDPEVKTWYRVIDGVRYTYIVEYPKLRKSKTFEYDAELNIVGTVEEELPDRSAKPKKLDEPEEADESDEFDDEQDD